VTAIAGRGAICAWGVGMAAADAGFAERRSALVDNDRWPTDWFLRGDAGLVPDFRPRKMLPERKAVKLMSREAQLATFAAVEAATGWTGDAKRLGAFAAAGYEVSSLAESEEMLALSADHGEIALERLFGPGRAACNPLSPLKILPNMALFHAVAAVGAQGPHQALGSSPAAGIAALCEAVDALQYGEADGALVLGADAQVEVFRAHLLAETGVAETLAPGEGAAALLLGGDGPVKVLACAIGQEPVAGTEPREHYGRIADGGRARAALYAEVAGDGVDLAIADLWNDPARDAKERAALPDCDVVGTRAMIGWTGAAHGLLDVVLAAALVESGAAERVLITCSGLAGDLGAVLVGR